MSFATITSKGQVTIPKNIRDSLHLNSGDKIELELLNNGEAVMRPVRKSVDDVFACLKQDGQRSISVEEMNSALKERF
jgi:antitoxin PrlF